MDLPEFKVDTKGGKSLGGGLVGGLVGSAVTGGMTSRTRRKEAAEAASNAKELMTHGHILHEQREDSAHRRSEEKASSAHERTKDLIDHVRGNAVIKKADIKSGGDISVTMGKHPAAVGRQFLGLQEGIPTIPKKTSRKSREEFVDKARRTTPHAEI